MVTKKELLKNLQNYSPMEIADAVKNGTITLYELSKDTQGAFTPLLKKKVKELLDASETIVEEANDAPMQEPLISQDDITDNSMEFEQTDSTELPEVQYFSEETESSESDDDIVDNSGMFKRPFNFFTGRIRRLEYGLSMIITYVYSFVAGFVVVSNRWDENLIYVILIPAYWFVWAQGAKRCHDRGNSGWYQLIPFYGLWMLFADGDPGDNEYGSNPKE